MSACVVISKSPVVAVRPSEPVAGTGHTINLSSYDKMFHGTAPAATLFLIFEHSIHEPAETIKGGLSRALFHYYPLCGRLAMGGDGLVINCTGEGVSFVAASANCTMKDLRSKLSDRWLQKELAIFYPESNSQPFVMMQVTVFSCGGFVVGVTWDHAVEDGVGLAQFLQTVAELSRGVPSPSVVPVRSPDALTLGAPPPFYTDFMQFMSGSLEPCPVAFLETTVSSSLISRIKHDYAMKNYGQHCSAFDALAAVLWRCRTRATMPDDPEALAVLAIAQNMRVYAGAREGYYGNCMTAHPVRATCGVVAGVNMLELVEIIRRGKKRVPGESDMDRLRRGSLVGYNLLRMSSWQGLGLEAPDFGGGRPVRVMGCWGDKQQISLPLCASLPCKADYKVISMCVREEHVQSLRRELAMIHLAYHPKL